jgi:hypothetical protein
MRRYSRFDCGIWNEPWFRELPDDSPLLWLWLNHNEHVLACGLQRLDVARASRETLLPERDVARWIEGWERLGLLRCDGKFVLLPLFSRQQSYGRERRLAVRHAKALSCETQLAVEWLEQQRGDNVGVSVGAY